MAVALGMMSGGLMGVKNRKKMKINCVASSTSHWSSSSLSAGLVDKFRTLRIEPGASENEVKKAFRRLALQYHPDVCKGSNCGVQFHRINEAYDVVMSYLRGESIDGMGFYDPDNDESSNIVVDDDDMRGMCDPDWDLWEEWMGWEGAGIRDYSSHINPYI